MERPAEQHAGDTIAPTLITNHSRGRDRPHGRPPHGSRRAELPHRAPAEGAISGDSLGVRFESTDTLAELVADVVDEVREISQARGGTAIGVTWYMAELIDDAEGAERMAHELAAAEGVELPARVSA